MDDDATLIEEMARQTPQAKLIRDAREKLEITSEELAELLGVSLPTLRGWLTPADNKVHREMPLTAKLLLARILADPKKRT
jgi:DNA-binding transcriptional regulator YiaG